MTEQQTDFLKIKQNIGKISPQQLGSLMRQYYEKHLADIPVQKTYLDEVVGLFQEPLDSKSVSAKMPV
jgi:hypothetical protein